MVFPTVSKAEFSKAFDVITGTFMYSELSNEYSNPFEDTDDINELSRSMGFGNVLNENGTEVSEACDAIAKYDRDNAFIWVADYFTPNADGFKFICDELDDMYYSISSTEYRWEVYDSDGIQIAIDYNEDDDMFCVWAYGMGEFYTWDFAASVNTKSSLYVALKNKVDSVLSD